MLIIVFDDNKKFDKNHLQLVPNILGKSQIFTNIDKNDEHIKNLVYTHKHLKSGGIIDYDNVVILSPGVYGVPIDYRANADYIIFTTMSIFKEYFNRFIYNDTTARISKVLNAVSKLDNNDVVIWDVKNKQFC